MNHPLTNHWCFLPPIAHHSPLVSHPRFFFFYISSRTFTYLQEQHSEGGLVLAGGEHADYDETTTHNSKKSKSDKDKSDKKSGSKSGSSSNRRRAFDFLYYTEADNVLFMDRQEGVARAVSWEEQGRRR
jgi:hypothetical protein